MAEPDVMSLAMFDKPFKDPDDFVSVYMALHGTVEPHSKKQMHKRYKQLKRTMMPIWNEQTHMLCRDPWCYQRAKGYNLLHWYNTRKAIIERTQLHLQNKLIIDNLLNIA
jgi:starvation-inducible outer membrane lipoprotein